jgi:tricorn protease
MAIGRHSQDLAWWKRYRGGRTGVLWLDADGSGEFAQLDLEGQQGSPFYLNGRLWFVSDHAYYGNLFSVLPDGTDLQQQTHHTEHFIRWPSSDGRRVVYAAGGDLWLMDGAEPARIDVAFHSPRTQLQRKFVDASAWLDDYDVHPDGHSLALSLRGKTVLMGHWEGVPRQLGEPHGVRYRLPRYLSGDSVLLVSDAGGEEAFELHETAGEGVRRFEGLDVGRPVDVEISPDGERAAFTNHRGEVGIVHIESGELTAVDCSKWQRCSGLAWSACSRWLAWVSPHTRAGTTKVRIFEVSTGTTTDVTDGRYADTSPSFDPEGRYLYFLSHREFDPIYDNIYFDLGFTFGMRPYAVALRLDVPSPFLPAPAPLETGPPGAKDTETPPVTVDVAGLQARLMQFPVSEGRYERIVGLAGKVLLSKSVVSGGRAVEWRDTGPPPARTALHTFDFATQEFAPAHEAVSNFRLDRARKTLAYRSSDRMRVVSADAPKWKRPEERDKKSTGRVSGWVELTRASVEVELVAEWRQMFRETWRLMRDQFWTEDMSGVDWPAMYARYLPLIDRVGTRGEYSDVVWEMIGELGTSHAYEMLGDYRTSPQWRIGQLGGEYAWDEAAGGYRIVRMLAGEPGDPARSSPLVGPGAGLAVGDVILAINSRQVSREFPPSRLLSNQAGKVVRVTVAGADEPRSFEVRALKDVGPLAYRDWVCANRRAVHAATGGRVGYVHIPDMGPAGFAEFHRDYLTECTLDGLVVDVRYNRGGHVSQLLIEKLARKVRAWSVSRWESPGVYPAHTVVGPMVCLTNEMAGSDGDIFSHTFKLADLGPLVGTRTWGGVVGIWPRHAMVDGSIVTQPEFSTWFTDVGYDVENYGTDPQHEVDVAPQDFAADVDPQLAKGLELITGLLDTTPTGPPDFGDRVYLGVPE